MIICDEPTIAYFAPTKTGSTTVEHSLADQDIKIKIGRALKHDLWPGEKLVTLPADCFCMITLRNPYSRAVSMWSHFCKPLPAGRHTVNIESDLTHDSLGKSFVHWVSSVLMSDKHSDRYASYFRLQHEYLAAMPRVNAVLRQETLTSDILKLPFIDKEKWRVQHQRVGPYRRDHHWKMIYADDRGLIETVKSRFEADFEAAGYSLEFEEAT